MVSELFWTPRPELIAKAKAGETLTHLENLILASRTFAGPVQSLKRVRGENERDKMSYVVTMYLIDRLKDECEDGKLPVKEKINANNEINFILNEIVRRDAEKGIEDLIEGDKFQQAIKVIGKGILGKNQEEILSKKTFVKEFGKGLPLREFHSYDLSTKKLMLDAAQTMGTGMDNFLRGSIKTLDDLDKYCYYVAGSVGEFLTRLVELKDGIRLDINQAKELGKYLQLTNIIRNIREDFNEHKKISEKYQKNDSEKDQNNGDKKEEANRIYIPSDLSQGMDYEEVVTSDSQAAQGARYNIHDIMLNHVKKSSTKAINYLASIPSSSTGYKAFCVAPFYMAHMMLGEIEKSGSEQLFKQKKERRK